MKRFALVYQAGIANVFETGPFNTADKYSRGFTTRVLQSGFRTAEAFCLGAMAAGASVAVASCNRAGDITGEDWTPGLEDCPFRGDARPVWNAHFLDARSPKGWDVVEA